MAESSADGGTALQDGRLVIEGREEQSGSLTIKTINQQVEETVGSKTDQIKGLANQAAGKLKRGVGKITGSQETQARGAAQEVKGKAQRTMGKAKSAVKDTANKVADKANKKL